MIDEPDAKRPDEDYGDEAPDPVPDWHPDFQGINQSNERDKRISFAEKAEKYLKRGWDCFTYPFRRFWALRSNQHTAWATVVIAVFTFILAVCSYFTICILKGQRRDSQAVQRAFLYESGFDIHYGVVPTNPPTAGDSFFQTKMRNSGTTAALDVMYWVNAFACGGQINESFKFPDFVSNGKTATDSDYKAIAPTFAPPNSEQILAPLLEVTGQCMNSVRNKQGNLYLYGWMKYRDVFGNKHITRYCEQVSNIIDTVVSQAGDRQISVETTTCPKNWHNCVDEECKAGQP